MTVIRIVEKSIISIFLLVAVYFTITCNCDSAILSCNKITFYLLLIIPLLYVFIMNM